MKKILGILTLMMGVVVILILLMVGWSNSSSKLETRNSKLKVVTSPTPVINQAQTFKTKLYNLINAYRKENNLSPLVVYPALELSANYKLQDMISRNYWKHQDVQNRPPWQFFEQANYNYVKAGENLGFNQPTAFGVFDAWTKSPKHNQQLLNPDYEHMGLAVDCQTLKKLDSQSGCIVVLHLGKL